MLFLIVVIRFIDIGATNLCRVSAAECINGKVNYTYTYTYTYMYIPITTVCAALYGACPTDQSQLV